MSFRGYRTGPSVLNPRVNALQEFNKSAIAAHQAYQYNRPLRCRAVNNRFRAKVPETAQSISLSKQHCKLINGWADNRRTDPDGQRTSRPGTPHPYRQTGPAARYRDRERAGARLFPGPRLRVAGHDDSASGPVRTIKRSARSFGDKFGKTPWSSTTVAKQMVPEAIGACWQLTNDSLVVAGAIAKETL